MALQGSLTRHQNPNATGSDKFQLCEVLQHTRYCLVFWFQFTITNVRCKLQSPLGLRHSQNLLLTHLQAGTFSFVELHFSRGESFFSLSTSWLSSLYRFLPLQRHRLLSKTLLWFHLFQFASLASVVQLLLQFMHELCICIAGSTDFFELEARQHVNSYLRILAWSSNVLQRCFCSILTR